MRANEQGEAIGVNKQRLGRGEKTLFYKVAGGSIVVSLKLTQLIGLDFS